MQQEKMPPEAIAVPRIVVSALRGGSGKTIISLGITAALRDLGKKVAPFKKGPDYIDAGWLALAAGRSCYNLDTFLADEAVICESFLARTRKVDIAVIEGNRGLYDGIDIEGKTSTAEISKLFDAPVLLCLDCTKSTRTMAAAVLGLKHFDPDVKIAGAILNRVAGKRHTNILTKSLEHHCGVSVFGAIPKLRSQDFPERHMGLVPSQEHDWAHASIDAAAGIARKYVDLDAVIRSAEAAGAAIVPPANAGESPNAATGLGAAGESLTVRATETSDRPGGEGKREDASAAEAGTGKVPDTREATETTATATAMPGDGPKDAPTTGAVSAGAGTGAEKVRIGIVRDSAFQFYYTENIEALEQEGAEIVIISPLADRHMPEVDGIYMGGGFPETHAAELAENEGFRREFKALADGGLPVYAECGGLMYLGEELVLKEKAYPMTGILPIRFGFSKRPQGHGYTIIRVAGENPYFPVGTEIRGHEFRYSSVLEWKGDDADMVYAMTRGTGIKDNIDGISYKNVLATYTHLFAPGTPLWAKAVVRNALAYRGGAR